MRDNNLEEKSPTAGRVAKIKVEYNYDKIKKKLFHEIFP